MNDRRNPMSKDEYYALRQFIGILNCVINNDDILEQRCRQVKNGWRDYQMIRKVGMNLYERLFRTMPMMQQHHCRKELKNSYCHIEVKPSGNHEPHDIMSYVPQRPLERITDKLMGYECKFCDKCGKKVSRCQLRKDFESLYHYPIDRLPDGSCPFQGLIDT